jgi:hypothetical protein
MNKIKDCYFGLKFAVFLSFYFNAFQKKLFSQNFKLKPLKNYRKNYIDQYYKIHHFFDFFFKFCSYF